MMRFRRASHGRVARGCASLVRPVLSTGVDLEFPQGVAVLGGAGAASCRVWDASFRPLTSSIMSISPDWGQPPPIRIGDPSAQNAGQYPRPLAGFGCSIDAVISSFPPGGA